MRPAPEVQDPHAVVPRLGGGRSLTVKDRIPVDPAATAELDGEARAYADRVLCTDS